MIQHLVVFRFREDIAAATRAEVLAELGALPEAFPAMRNFRIGVNQSNRDDRFEYGFTVEFASVSDLDAYLGSERHERFVAERFRPNVAERAIVSFEPGSSASGGRGSATRADPAAVRP